MIARMSRVDVSIKRLDPAVSLPEYAYSGDAGLDCAAMRVLI